MGELSKMGKAIARGARIRLVVSIVMAIAPLVVLGWLCGSSFLAGMIHQDLAGPVFWLQFMCFPFAAVIFGVVLGLWLRGINLKPYREVLGPVAVESRYLLSGAKWTVTSPGPKAEFRLVRRSFTLVVEGDAFADIRGGRDNALARLATGSSWEVEELGEGVLVASKDGAALRAHLERDGVREAWSRLLVDDRRSLRALYLTPGKSATLSFRYIPTHLMTTEVVREWVADMDTILGNT